MLLYKTVYTVEIYGFRLSLGMTELAREGRDKINTYHRSSWVERVSPTYVLASGVVVLAVGNWFRQLSGLG